MSGIPEKVSEYVFRIPAGFKQGMRVDGIIYGDEDLLFRIGNENAFAQVANVAFLPGIVNYSLAMPDIHWGYGFPIGGVAATDPEQGGVISPGGVGFDINCGVRFIRTNIDIKEIRNKIPFIADKLYQAVPAGVGSRGNIRLSRREEEKVLVKGAAWAVEKGFGTRQDLECCEESGAFEGAEPEEVSLRAYERGREQLGTLGSGNHFLEMQTVEEVFDCEAASKMGLFLGQIVLMIHSGSRGLGYQVCEDYVRIMLKAVSTYGIKVPDRQMACAPVDSPEAARYLGAMRAAANFAWCNRQVLTHLVRKVFEDNFSRSWQDMGMSLLYDVTHNIAKFEKHNPDGKERILCVHRKGATRAFGPGNPDLPAVYRELGQPVIIPGDMGTASYLLLGTKTAEARTFGTTCHGAGRVKSRHQALATIDSGKLLSELNSRGIQVRARGKKIIAEEAPQAYKPVDRVVDVVHNSGLSTKVCRMRPLAVIKG